MSASCLVLISAKIFSVFHGRISLVFFKKFAEMTVILIAHQHRYVVHAQFLVLHQLLGFFETGPDELIDKIDARIRFELLAQIAGVIVIFHRVALQGNLFGILDGNILQHLF